jgi:adenine-specific DNA-methyltransferase
VPYNGEETHFHWANHDQYYIKSSETFQLYAFKIPTSSATMTVNFKLTAAQVEQGNVKADEPNYFMLSEKVAEIGEEESSFFFEYRPMNDEEKKNSKGNNKQDAFDEQAFEQIKANYGKTVSLAELWKTDKDGIALLLKKLHHYTRKNKYDFFIHKNLKGFLQRELDYYIKSELIAVDDLYVSETEGYFDSLKHRIKTIKVFKSIADVIIDFVSQIEDFQKKLWEKKKFVLSTEWVITIDRLVEYIGEEAAKPILEEVIKNEKQVSEWIELFGKENVPKTLSIESLKADLHAWRKLPIDTFYLNDDFKRILITTLSNKINLFEKQDGLVLNSDNYQGLTTLRDLFLGQIGSIYTDPPYNAKSSEIIYKNTFKHSSWVSLMNNTLSLTKDFLKETGSINIAIDDYEYRNLHQLIDSIYGSENFIANVSVIHNPRGRNDDKFYGTAHEYMLVYALDKNLTTFNNFSYSKEDLRQYNKVDEISKFAETSFMRTGNNSDRVTRPNLFYPIFYNQKTKELSITQKSNDFVELLPINSSSEEKTWRWSQDTFDEKKATELFVKEVNGELRLFKKRRLVESGKKPKTIWNDSRYDASANGIMILKSMFGRQIPFSYPKSLGTVIDAVHISANKNDIVLDFFPGSGTTFHATQYLNSIDTGSRKCILTEQGKYTYTVIIPRIKKIAYTFDWKDGKPKPSTGSGQGHSMNGLGVFFKYQRLEQYEEALENIAFTAPEAATQMALKLDSYIPKYFLEFETKGSQTLVNTAAMQDPWDYRLKVWDGFTYDTEQAVDLVETFNYLIGLHMQKCFTKEINGRKYQLVYGHNNASKNILVVWRSVKDWSIDDYKADSEALKKELAAFQYDLLYINDQAHIEGYQPIEEVFKNKMLP